MSDVDPRFQAARLVLSLRQAGVTDPRVARAMEVTPRDQFVPKAFKDDAWDNVELPIDCGQSMTRPVIVGTMLQALGAGPEHSVLEIGTGTGYVAAVLGRLARRVCTVDRYRTLVDRARALLDQLNLGSNVEMRHADGLLGWPEAAPFDRILLMGSAKALPNELVEQLGPGGVAVLPVERGGRSVIVRLERLADGGFDELVLGQGNFTPLQPGIAREL